MLFSLPDSLICPGAPLRGARVPPRKRWKRRCLHMHVRGEGSKHRAVPSDKRESWSSAGWYSRRRDGGGCEPPLCPAVLRGSHPIAAPETTGWLHTSKLSRQTTSPARRAAGWGMFCPHSELSPPSKKNFYPWIRVLPRKPKKENRARNARQARVGWQTHEEDPPVVIVLPKSRE